MYRRIIFATFLIVTVVSAVPLGSNFTYQGELIQSGTEASGAFDFQIRLFDVEVGGTAIAPSPILLEDIDVVNGIFTVDLDFGIAPFAGDRLWLEISVREGASTGGFTDLLPRQQKGDNGIQTSEGAMVAHSAAFNNFTDGIDVAAGSAVFNTTVTDNRSFGIDLALGGTVQGSTAYDNNRNGIDVASAAIVRDNVATLNGACVAGEGYPLCSDSDGDGTPGPEHGIRTFANSWIVGNKSHENDGDGIRVSSTDVLVEGNSVTDNDLTGIRVTSSGGLIIRNKAAGNLLDYDIVSSSAFGPIVDVTSAGDISSIPNSDHPQANFRY